MFYYFTQLVTEQIYMNQQQWKKNTQPNFLNFLYYKLAVMFFANA